MNPFNKFIKMYHAIEDLINVYEQGTGLVGILINEPLDEPLNVGSIIRSLRGDIERTKKRLEIAKQDPERYSKSIKAYEERIADKEQRIKELTGEAGVVVGGSRRPTRDNFDLNSDKYEKEKADIRRYFSADVIGSVLKNPEDMWYVAKGLRFLNSLGRQLDNYEIGIPADYRLGLLRRLGRNLEFFRDRDVVWYQPPENMDEGFVFRTDFIEDQSRPVKYRHGLSSYDEPFEKGFRRDNENYPELWKFVFVRSTQAFPYIGTSKNKPPSVEEFTWITRRCYLYVINPRGLNAIDVEDSYEAQYDQFEEARKKRIIPLTDTTIGDPQNATKRQREVTFINYIDPRDIKGCFKIELVQQGDKRIPRLVGEFISNPNYLPSHWELPGPYKM